MVLVVGDVHANFAALQAVIVHTKAQQVLQVGDFGYWPNIQQFQLPKNGFTGANGKPVPVHFCDGNHEDHHSLAKLLATGTTEVAPHVFYQPRGSVLVLEDGRRVLFAGGAQSADRHLRVENESWFEEELLTQQEVLAFPPAPIDIVISHAAPASVKLPPFTLTDKQTDPSRLALDMILSLYAPKLWCFGHYHEAFTQNVQGCSFVALSPVDNYPEQALDGAVSELEVGI